MKPGGVWYGFEILEHQMKESSMELLPSEKLVYGYFQ